MKLLRIAARVAAIPVKYEHIKFKPPKSVMEAADKGLSYRRKTGKGALTEAQAAKAGVGSGVARAKSLKRGQNQAPNTIRRMVNFFTRHQKNKAIDAGKLPWEDKGWVAWLTWGGDPGFAWAKKVRRQMDAADEKAKK